MRVGRSSPKSGISIPLPFSNLLLSPPARHLVRSCDVDFWNNIVDLGTYLFKATCTRTSQHTLSKSSYVIWKLDRILAGTDRLGSALGCTAVIGEFHHRIEARIEHDAISLSLT